MEQNDFKMIDAHTKIEVLEDRFDRHLSDVKDSISNQNLKLEAISLSLTNLKVDLIKSVSEARIEQIKDSTGSKIGVAAISGTISAVMAFLVAWWRSPK